MVFKQSRHYNGIRSSNPSNKHSYNTICSSAWIFPSSSFFGSIIKIRITVKRGFLGTVISVQCLEYRRFFSKKRVIVITHLLTLSSGPTGGLRPEKWWYEMTTSLYNYFWKILFQTYLFSEFCVYDFLFFYSFFLLKRRFIYVIPHHLCRARRLNLSRPYKRTIGRHDVNGTDIIPSLL